MTSAYGKKQIKWSSVASADIESVLNLKIHNSRYNTINTHPIELASDE